MSNKMPARYQDDIEIPTPYPPQMQKYSTLYPDNFVMAPNPYYQSLVYYNGKPMLQGLSRVSGPIMFPREMYLNNRTYDQRQRLANGTAPELGILRVPRITDIVVPANAYVNTQATPWFNSAPYPVSSSSPDQFMLRYIFAR